MIRKTFALLLLATLAGFAAPAQTADEILQKSLEATGGQAKLDAIKSMRMTGKTVLPQGIEAPFVMELQNPRKLRMDMTVQGMTLSQAYDGKNGWKVVPFTGKTDPEPMSPEELEAMSKQSLSFNFFTEYKNQGYKSEYVGKEDLEGTPVHKVKLTSKDGDVLHMYFDAEQYLPVKMAAKTMVQGQEFESETTLGGYKEAGGLLFAHSYETKLRNFPGAIAMTIDKIEVNPDIPASRFEMPAVAKKPETPEKTENKEAPKPPVF